MEKQEGRAASAVRLDDPWYDALASDWGEPDGTGGTGGGTGAPLAAGGAGTGTGTGTGTGAPSASDIYREVQRSAAFQEVRGRYRRFVVPASLAFLTWYLAYVVAATTAPGLMARPVAGAVNVAMLAGLGQFLSTFLLTWAYVRHARLHRDRAALELRWAVFDQERTNQDRTQRERTHQDRTHHDRTSGEAGR
ncbi:DUF485 domain-containing protein [Streptomyces paludis]|uniref:DUF485 domain-containing protein n=1 Tax=Streptomyces paludis TaxID=2282738 RepID=A0A345HVG7_9ACTN|nr:DUF485 domain-containing protein [Streptomyces paludis]AXG80691.1 DUF485 domain-containing protein [Streptomyces paludis]